MIFNSENLCQPDKDWPSKGLLVGSNLLDAKSFEEISQFDFTKCSSNSFGFGGRKTAQFLPGKLQSDKPSQILQELVEELNDKDLFAKLLSSALNDVQENIWAKDIDYAVSLFMSPLLLVSVDSPNYEIGIHNDYSPAMQIYLGPEDANGGTKFHKYGEVEVSKQLPFIPNSGYFNVNSRYGQHSAKGLVGKYRKSLMVFWLLNQRDTQSMF